MSQNTRRILVFSTNYLPYIGGAELALKEIMERLSGIQFDVITSRLDKSLSEKETFQNINLYRVGSSWFLKNIFLPKNFYPLSAFAKAIGLARKNKYSAMLALQASQGAGAAWLFKFLHPKMPFILNIQEGKNLGQQGFLINFFRKLILKKADIITVISSYLRDYVSKINSKAKLFVIPNGVNLEKFKNLEHKTNNQDKTIITVSRLVEKNGVEDLIDAFHILNTKYNIQNTRLMIIGDGPLKEALKIKILNLKLESKVTLLGSIANEDLPKYLTQADVFARPSLSEGLGTAFLEAMAADLPVVGTARGGIVDFLKDKETGLVCEAENPDDLAQKLSLILSNSNLYESIVKNARKLIEEKYDWNIITKQYEEIINSYTRI